MLFCELLSISSFSLQKNGLKGTHSNIGHRILGGLKFTHIRVANFVFVFLIIIILSFSTLRDHLFEHLLHLCLSIAVSVYSAIVSVN